MVLWPLGVADLGGIPTLPRLAALAKHRRRPANPRLGVQHLAPLRRPERDPRGVRPPVSRPNITHGLAVHAAAVSGQMVDVVTDSASGCPKQARAHHGRGVNDQGPRRASGQQAAIMARGRVPALGAGPIDRPGGVHRVVCTRDGVRIATYDSGPSDAARTIVFLHGLCLSSQSWSATIDLLPVQLTKAARIICYDHRGHGRSGQAAVASYNVDQLADDLGDVMTTLRVTGSVTLVGHSLGGMTALTYCARPRHQQPVLAERLVLVATAAGRLTDQGVGRLLATPGPDLLCGLVGHVPAAAVDRTVRAAAGPACGLLARWGRLGKAQRQVLRDMCATALTSTALSTAAGFLPQLRRFDQSGALAQIHARTTILSGGMDCVTPMWHAQQMAMGIEGADHRHYPDAGHMLLQQVPHAVADAIVANAPAPALAAAAVTA